ncbi:MAG: hypothetical protein ACO35F_11270, partial [Ilumatobacteraceae bacterium]
MTFLRRHLQRELTRVVDATTGTSTRRVLVAGSTPDQSDDQVVIPGSGSGLAAAADLHTAHVSAARHDPPAVVLLGTLNRVDDVYHALEGVSEIWSPTTRLISVSYNRLWRPIVRLMRSLTGAEAH